jgi:hypothetical protein
MFASQETLASLLRAIHSAQVCVATLIACRACRTRLIPCNFPTTAAGGHGCSGRGGETAGPPAAALIRARERLTRLLDPLTCHAVVATSRPPRRDRIDVLPA